MRSLVIALPLALALWAGILWLFSEYGFDAIALLMIFFGGTYILATIWRDWPQRPADEWEDGEPVNYGSDK